MKCGHASNMKDKHGNVICGICNCKEVLDECNDDVLKGRRAICNQHKNGCRGDGSIDTFLRLRDVPKWYR